jgi:hypothetical protein
MKKSKTSANPSRDGFFRWVVEIEVHKTWVEDGFNLDDDRAHGMLTRELSHAYGHEVRARVLSAPHKDDIAKTQGEA